MSDLLITQARLIDPATQDDTGAEPAWLLVRAGRIADTGRGTPPSVEAPVHDANGCAVLPAFIDVDVRADLSGAAGDPWPALAHAAARGGVGTLLIHAQPPNRLTTPEAVTHLLSESGGAPSVRGLAAGALVQDERLCELGLMREAGAAAFTALSPVQDSKLLQSALIAAAHGGAPVLSPARDAALEAEACAHEGATAARLGLPGAPPVSEAIAIARDAALARAADATLILTGVTTREGLAAAQLAKQQSRDTGRGRVFIAAPAYALALNDLELHSFDGRFHMSPPLREEEDRQALIDAVASGLVDIVTSQHDAVPLHLKQHPFADAAPGAPGLETLAAILAGLTQDNRMSVAEAFRAVTTSPADVLGLETGRLAVGAPADLAIMDLAAPWRCEAAAFASTGRVTPLEGRLMTGRVRATIVGGAVLYDGVLSAAALA